MSRLTSCSCSEVDFSVHDRAAVFFIVFERQEGRDLAHERLDPWVKRDVCSSNHSMALGLVAIMTSINEIKRAARDMRKHPDGTKIRASFEPHFKLRRDRFPDRPRDDRRSCICGDSKYTAFTGTAERHAAKHRSAGDFRRSADVAGSPSLAGQRASGPLLSEGVVALCGDRIQLVRAWRGEWRNSSKGPFATPGERWRAALRRRR